MTKQVRTRILVLGLACALVSGFAIWKHDRISVDDARVEADLVVLSARVAGMVRDPIAHDGQHVRHGELLVGLDEEQALLAVQGIERDMAITQTDIEKARADLRIQLESAQIEDNSAIAAVRTAGVQLALARQQRTLAQQEGLRARQLVEAGFLSAAGVERYEQADLNARIDSEKSSHTHESAMEQKARADLMRQKAALLALDLKNANVRLERERIDRSALLADLAKHRVISPIDGVVDKVFVRPGEYLSTGKRILLLHDDATLRVEANVKESDIEHIAVGQHVKVVIDGCRDQDGSGVVSMIGSTTTGEYNVLPAVVPAGSFVKIPQRIPVRIHLLDQPCKVRPGMQVEVQFWS